MSNEEAKLKFLPMSSVVEITGTGKSKLYQMIKDGEFPMSVPIRGGRVWIEDEVQAWMREQVAAARGA